MVSEAVRGVARVYSTLISGYFSRKPLKKLFACRSSGVPEVNRTLPSFFARLTISAKVLPKLSGVGAAAYAGVTAKCKLPIKAADTATKQEETIRNCHCFMVSASLTFLVFFPFPFNAGAGRTNRGRFSSRFGLRNFLRPSLNEN